MFICMYRMKVVVYVVVVVLVATATAIAAVVVNDIEKLPAKTPSKPHKDAFNESHTPD